MMAAVLEGLQEGLWDIEHKHHWFVALALFRILAGHPPELSHPLDVSSLDRKTSLSIRSTVLRLTQRQYVEAVRFMTYNLSWCFTLYRWFWLQRYERLEGAHIFLSALRCARIHNCCTFALIAVEDYLAHCDRLSANAHDVILQSIVRTRHLLPLAATARLVQHLKERSKLSAANEALIESVARSRSLPTQRFGL
jgi:hypothetical protein